MDLICCLNSPKVDHCVRGGSHVVRNSESHHSNLTIVVTYLSSSKLSYHGDDDDDDNNDNIKELGSAADDGFITQAVSI
jgi:hypothetical protein